MRLAIKRSITPQSHAQPWDYQVDGEWFISLNHHAVDQINSHGQTVPKFNCVIEFLTMPVAVINPYGGAFVSHPMANENNFIDAMNDTLAEKSRAGHMLAGKEHFEFPKVAE